MGLITNIAWTDFTVNAGWGCRKVDDDPLTGACYNCYMFRMSPSFGRDPSKPVLLNQERLHFTIRKAIKDGKKRCFFNSMTDTFGEFFSFEQIERWHKEIFEAYPEITFQVLTKRIGRAMLFYRQSRVPDNVWTGTSIGSRKQLWRLERLERIYAPVRFVSFEPLLEDLGQPALGNIQWAIVGGESDKSSPRPMKLEWAANLAQACKLQGIAYFFKQRGGKGGDGAGGNICPCCNSVHQEFLF